MFSIPNKMSFTCSAGRKRATFDAVAVDEGGGESTDTSGFPSLSPYRPDAVLELIWVPSGRATVYLNAEGERSESGGSDDAVVITGDVRRESMLIVE